MRVMTLLLALSLVALVGCEDPETSAEDLDTTGNNTASNNNPNNNPNNTSNNSNNSNNTDPNNNSNHNDGPFNSGSPRNNDRPNVDTTPDPACIADWRVFYEGFVTDPGLNPLFAKAQLCVRNPQDLLVCLAPADADASDGFFSIAVPENNRCVAEATMRSLVPGADSSTFYCHIEGEASEPIVRLDFPVVIHPTERATTLPPEGDTTASRTVVFGDGLEIDVVPDDFFASYERLAANEVDPSDLCFLEGKDEPMAVYAFSPEGDIDGAGFPVRLPNTKGLAAGAIVDLYVLGGLSCTLADGTALAEAEWAQFGTGTVTEDGSMIASDPGSNLPCVNWMGYK